MMPSTGMNILLDMLAKYGVRYIFGNPGTTELPLNDALLADKRFQYILGLQEIPVLGIADGYAQASRSLGVVNVHISCGLGNAMGMLYNAFREHTPLLVTAGQQDRRMMFEEPILWGEMVETVRPWTKWAHEVRNLAELPSAIRRAVQAAMTPPTGPVFLSLPLDLQMEIAEGLDASVPALPSTLIRPSVEALEQAVAVLKTARRPGILVGNRINEADAVAELVAVAELLGSPVIHEAITSHGRSSFPSDHPLAGGLLPTWSPDVRERLSEFDVILVAGMKLMQQYIYHEPARPIPENICLVQIDDSPWELNKNYPLSASVWGHPKVALAEIADLLQKNLSPEQREAARRRMEEHRQRRDHEKAEMAALAESHGAIRPMTPAFFMETLSRILPENAAIIEESPTTTNSSYFERRGVLKNTSGFFAQRGWSLGWGLNCAIGVKLAWPDRPVLALIGDGSAMYGIQGLWTAAHYRIPATFVICNNAEYKILKDCAGILKLPAACRSEFESLDLLEPAIDYVGLAQSLGVAACRVSEPDELVEKIRWSWTQQEPQLIEVTVKQKMN